MESSSGKRGRPITYYCSRRLSITLDGSAYEMVKQLAASRKTSLNAVINDILSRYGALISSARQAN